MRSTRKRSKRTAPASPEIEKIERLTALAASTLAAELKKFHARMQHQLRDCPTVVEQVRSLTARGLYVSPAVLRRIDAFEDVTNLLLGAERSDDGGPKEWATWLEATL